ncbi:hypothetical protein Q5752_001092 [Cryptotrichosporon argae]
MQTILLQRRLENEWAPRAVPAPASSGLSLESTGASKEADAFLVDWEENDPVKPQNWSMLKKWMVTALLAQLITMVSAASSINSGALVDAALHYNVGTELMTLDTALFLTGFGVASVLWAPLSEVGGRTPVYIAAFFLFILFEVGAACSTTLYARVITRFLAGCCATPPLANASGGMNDIWTPVERTYGFTAAAVGGFFGPCLGPVMGGWIGPTIGFEWCDWIQVIWGGANLAAIILILPETFPPQLLRMKAAALRKHTGDARYMTAFERGRAHLSFYRIFIDAIKRPFLMMLLEPIVQTMCLYLTVVYIILFGDLIAWAFIFTDTWALSEGMTGTTFLSIGVGLLACGALSPLLLSDYKRQVARATAAGALVAPEARLRIAIVGTWLIPVSLFWGAWVADRSISIWAELVAQAVFGLGILTVFIATFQYLIDAYSMYAASALAAITFLRYPITAGAVMWTAPQYEGMGVHWSMTFLAFVSLVCCPIPWVFYRYGARLRALSRYTPNLEVKPHAVRHAVEDDLERIASALGPSWSRRSEAGAV